MKSGGMDSRTQCAVRINQSNSDLLEIFARRALGFLKRQILQELTPVSMDSLREYLQSGQRAVHAWQQGFNPARVMFAREDLQYFNTQMDIVARSAEK